MNPIPLCTSCLGPLWETTQRHDDFLWAVQWRCARCKQLFHCCDRSCATRKVTAFPSHAQLAHHHRGKHKKPRLAEVVVVADMVDDDDAQIGPFEGNESTKIPIPTEAYAIFRGHTPTKRFFGDLKLQSFDEAARNLVARSCFLDSKIDSTANLGFSVTDLMMFLRIARLVFKLGPTHQHLLAGVLSGFETRYRPLNGSVICASRHELPLPTTHKAFVAKLLNPTNTNSLSSILPAPPALSLGLKHAYVSIASLIAYDLGISNASVDSPYNVKFQRLVDSDHGRRCSTAQKNSWR